jgi:hypothetical protein
MVNRLLLCMGLSLLLTSSVCLEMAYGQSATGEDWKPLFSHIWRVVDVPNKAQPGAIYVFLASGTVLETSCVETYRIATWTIDKKSPRILRVIEDGRLAFTATITVTSKDTLKLHQELASNKEKRDITLAAVGGEFVCPDMPK